MTKAELLKEMNELLKMRGMAKIDGGNGAIGWNDNKATIQGAIDCLRLTDGEMRDYLTVVKLKYPGTYRVVTENGDPLTHYHNRFYIYNIARCARLTERRRKKSWWTKI